MLPCCHPSRFHRAVPHVADYVCVSAACRFTCHTRGFAIWFWSVLLWTGGRYAHLPCRFCLQLRSPWFHHCLPGFPFCWTCTAVPAVLLVLHAPTHLWFRATVITATVITRFLPRHRMPDSVRLPATCHATLPGTYCCLPPGCVSWLFWPHLDSCAVGWTDLPVCAPATRAPFCYYQNALYLCCRYYYTWFTTLVGYCLAQLLRGSTLTAYDLRTPYTRSAVILEHITVCSGFCHARNAAHAALFIPSSFLLPPCVRLLVCRAHRSADRFAACGMPAGSPRTAYWTPLLLVYCVRITPVGYTQRNNTKRTVPCSRATLRCCCHPPLPGCLRTFAPAPILRITRLRSFAVGFCQHPAFWCQFRSSADTSLTVMPVRVARGFSVYDILPVLLPPFGWIVSFVLLPLYAGLRTLLPRRDCRAAYSTTHGLVSWLLCRTTLQNFTLRVPALTRVALPSCWLPVRSCRRCAPPAVSSAAGCFAAPPRLITAATCYRSLLPLTVPYTFCYYTRLPPAVMPLFCYRTTACATAFRLFCRWRALLRYTATRPLLTGSRLLLHAAPTPTPTHNLPSLPAGFLCRSCYYQPPCCCHCVSHLVPHSAPAACRTVLPRPVATRSPTIYLTTQLFLPLHFITSYGWMGWIGCTRLRAPVTGFCRYSKLPFCVFGFETVLRRSALPPCFNLLVITNVVPFYVPLRLRFFPAAACSVRSLPDLPIVPVLTGWLYYRFTFTVRHATVPH